MTKVSDDNRGHASTIIIVVVVIIVIGLVFWRIRDNIRKHTAVSNSNATTATPTIPPATTVPTNNTSSDPALNSSLNSAGLSINQDNQNLNSASSAVNDKNSQVAVPSQ